MMSHLPSAVADLLAAGLREKDLSALMSSPLTLKPTEAQVKDVLQLFRARADAGTAPIKEITASAPSAHS